MNKEYSNSMFPTQKLPMNKKTKEWGEACVSYIIGAGEMSRPGTNRTRFNEMQTYYDLYNSIYDEKDLKYVTNPFKQNDGFPATAKDYNIIRPKVDLLIGEESRKPFDFVISRTSDDATSELQDKGKEMIIQYMMAATMANMSPQEQQQFQEKLQTGEIQPPEQIQKYLTKDYKDIAESTAYHALNYLRKKLNTDHEFLKAWKDALIAGEEIIYVGISNGDPILRRVNPMYFAYENSPDLEFIDDATWCMEKLRMSYTEIYDMLYDKIDEDMLDKLLEFVDGGTGRAMAEGYRGVGNDYNHIRTSIQSGNPFANANANRGMETVDLWHVCWRSFRKIGFVVLPNDETGETEQFEVDESYVPTGMEISLDWEWVIDIWEGWRANDDLYFGVQPLQYQHISADNPNSRKLPYTGAVYSNTNSVPKSLVSLLRPLQYMYIILWYRLELTMARDKGKVLNMDITQIPKSMEIDVPRWLHMLSSIGINLINPYEEGWDIPGREGGRPATYNQISSVDLTMSNVISQYIELMMKIEDMVSEMSGVNKQRQGAIAPNELATNAQQNISQSSYITEPLVWLHNQVKRRALTMLLDTSKSVWGEYDKTYLNYITDEGERAFYKLSDKFLYEDYDIFCTNATEELQNLEQLKQLYQPAMQNGASLLDIAEIMTLKSINTIKEKLGEIDERNQQRIQEQQQQEQQSQQQIAQMQQQTDQQELQLEQAKQELDRYKIDQDNQTRIAVAEIGAFRFQKDLDVNGNRIPDPIEIANAQQKQLELSQQQFDSQNNLGIEQDKNKIAREKMAHEKTMQQMKDNEAYKREVLKSKTALKNPTNAEAARGKK